MSTLDTSAPGAALGTMVKTTPKQLRFVRVLPQPIERVWAALTDPEERAGWFGRARIEPHVRGAIEMDPDDPPVDARLKQVHGQIQVWVPPRVLEHTWFQRIVGEAVVRYALAAEGSGTRLTFTHRGLSVPNAQGFIPGTHAYLDRLAAHLAGEPVPVWQNRYNELAPSYGIASLRSSPA